MSVTSHVATVTTKANKAVPNQHKTSLSSTLLQFLCLAKLAAKAFHPLLSHESPTGYDPPKLLLLSDHFVVEGLLCERGTEQAQGLTRCSCLAKDKQIHLFIPYSFSFVY